ncbi:MAG: methyltransferase domain-containing protein [bacterium]
MKIHLGCGGTYLNGYINIDYPTDDKTIMDVKADVYQDITTLEYPDNSLDEIRSHHLFEHFNRVDVLKLLAKWRRWLKPGGKLVIETPDYFWISVLLPFVPFFFRMRLGRHLFGTQEASWANHLDFWDKRKFKKVLSKYGFNNFKFRHPLYRNFMPNIKVICTKKEVDINESKIIKEILAWYILPLENKEKFMKNWLN